MRIVELCARPRGNRRERSIRGSELDPAEIRELLADRVNDLGQRPFVIEGFDERGTDARDEGDASRGTLQFIDAD
ncbi:MAG TPA: hypothetical protein VE591_14920, partial [Candidatus Acidoferrum sp.]|nr:hypothetical protein [Candidatus Acidoferrum sp.]